MSEFLDKLVSVVPSKRQLEWQKLEFTAFFHYGINSFTDREWGDGAEDIKIFSPRSVDTDNWCRAIKKAGMKACIITAKHHDGFCLWNTKYTSHCVTHTPYKRDIVKQLSDSCQAYGIKLGVYLSPWDRHEETYGQGKLYDDYFCNQLEELLTGYGELYTIWFDGACGEGKNGKKQIYAWERYYSLIRKLQPNAVISVCGPDVRWCGNEAGDCRKSEWSVVPKELFISNKMEEASQQEESVEFRSRLIDVQDEDLGSRTVIKGFKDWIWYPAEVDISIRPGWFYHDSEDNIVRSLAELKKIYLNSVGGNSVLLLNIPPHKDGYIHENDRKRLEELGVFIEETFSKNLLEESKIYIVYPRDDSIDIDHLNHIKILVKFLREENGEYLSLDYKKREDGKIACPSLLIQLEKKTQIEYIVLKEHIMKSQRIEEFSVDVFLKGNWVTVYKGSVVGYKKICKVEAFVTKVIRINFLRSRQTINLEFLGVYGK